MGDEKFGEKIIWQTLTIPDVGQAYLKAALNQNDETIFLQALHDIMDSFLDEAAAANQEKILHLSIDN